MPNAKCNKCNLYLDDICKETKHINRFKDLINARVKRFYGYPYLITPGIRHNEIIKKESWYDMSKICDGVLYYDHFAENPKNQELINMLKLTLTNDEEQMLTKIEPSDVTEIVDNYEKTIEHNYFKNYMYFILLMTVFIIYKIHI
jgi:hypothetical protein